MTKTANRVVTTHLPVMLADKVDRLARKLDRPREWIVKQALTAWIAQEEERDLMTREALADVDADRILDDTAIQALAGTLATTEAAPVTRP